MRLPTVFLLPSSLSHDERAATTHLHAYAATAVKRPSVSFGKRGTSGSKDVMDHPTPLPIPSMPPITTTMSDQYGPFDRPSLEGMKVTQLRDICRTLCVSAKGRKDELIDRLVLYNDRTANGDRHTQHQGDPESDDSAAGASAVGADHHSGAHHRHTRASLEKLTVVELKSICREMDRYVSKHMRKADIIHTILTDHTDTDGQHRHPRRPDTAIRQTEMARQRAEHLAAAPLYPQEEDAGAAKTNKGFCPSCGASLPKKARFCPECGFKIDERPETLKDFVTKTFLPVRAEEVGAHTIRVEKGFWTHILKHLGSVPLTDLTPKHWEDYLRLLKERGCSARTLSLHQAAYQAALKYGVYSGRVAKMPPFRVIKGSTRRTRPIIPFTADEVRRLLDACSSPMYRALFGLGAGLGLRPSELVQVRWEDVDMDRATLRVRGSKTSTSGATIPLTPIALREMKQWWELEKRPRTGRCFYQRVFEDQMKTQPLQKEIRCFKLALENTARRAGVDVTEDGRTRRVFPYILRHSFATLSATFNPPVPLAVAQAVMRHTSSKMLLETYAKAGALVIRDGLQNFNV
mmetsp:Transcript_8755/g.25061  ORF Transcript_8755/g.25061 Transcript_8755/m.25061 type:complete len:576 (-) Transcript_8755:548-2275(-)